MHCHGFIEVEVPLHRLQVVLVFEEIQSLKHIGLLDETRSQNSVPRPFLIQRSVVWRQILNREEFLIQKPILLQENPPLFIFREIHLDRKSTRLNSSHVKTSYAVFC